MQLLALIVPGLLVSAAIPKTFTTFSADSTMTTQAGPIKIIMTGKTTVDNQLRRLRTDISKVAIKMDFSGGGLGGGGLPGAGGGLPGAGGGFPGGFGGGLPTGGDSGGGFPTGGAGGGFPTGGAGGNFPGFPGAGGFRRLAQAGGLGGGDMEIAASGVELLRFDLKKNFSWVKRPDGTTLCVCVDLTAPMPQFAVDPKVDDKGAQTIQSNGVDVVTNKWASTLVLGAAGVLGVSSEMAYFVEGLDTLRQMSMTSLSNAGGVSIATGATYDFWNVKNLEEDPNLGWSDPHPSCKCPSAPTLPMAKTYPPALPATCSPMTGCACLKLTNGVLTNGVSQIDFCKDEVTWQISQTLFLDQTDRFVKEAYDMWASTFASPSDKCLADYKTFLCKFYFQICTAGGILQFPPAFGACSTALGDSIMISTVETSGYIQTANLAAGKSAGKSAERKSAKGGPQASTASTTSAISLALALPVAAAFL